MTCAKHCSHINRCPSPYACGTLHRASAWEPDLPIQSLREPEGYGFWMACAAMVIAAVLLFVVWAVCAASI